MNHRRYKSADIIAALKATDGKVYLAAQRVGCDPDTIYIRAKQEPKIQAVMTQARGEFVDVAETALKRAVLAGEGWAICFALKCLGKDRGYVERQEITGAEGGPLNDGFTDAERLARIAAIFDRIRARGNQPPPERNGHAPVDPTAGSANGSVP